MSQFSYNINDFAVSLITVNKKICNRPGVTLSLEVKSDVKVI